MNIVLCGMMGVGKTSVATALAEATGRRCVDTDGLIVEKHGEINRIFAEHGEAYFRDLETDTARALSATDGLIIATGGGFVLREENARMMKERGKIVFLRAELNTLLGRIGSDESRPLLKDGAEKKLRELLPLRTPVYSRVADYIVDTDGKSVQEIASEILRLTEKKA